MGRLFPDSRTLGKGRKVEKVSKQFFFEKKNQKTFTYEA
jgi:hypothetical protein